MRRSNTQIKNAQKNTNTQPKKIPNNYVEYTQYLKNKGYNNEEINIDEHSKIVTTRSLAKNTMGTVIDIRCPCGYKISIAGREQSPENAHTLAVMLADMENIEIAPDTRIRIVKEKTSESITVIGYFFYKDISVVEFLKDPPNKTKEHDKFFRFNNLIEMNGEEHLQIIAAYPDIDIDATHINLSLDIDLWEQE